MYLKTIELHGFKSFAERTRLEMGPGIMAVVGPNGCGKSNVVDSVRWAIGEQSAHSLRSKNMVDVIFNGSQTRSATGFAEVTLTFDNSQNVIPLNYTEICVTRKLFRSGESEYYVNKIQCRLKDVRDLFLDTGIGAEGYSIFEQGKVDFITNAKPEERRRLFEETAGVSKYKVRREETLHKLDKVHQDMDRVNDMMVLIKEQIDSLESAVRKAKQYNKYQEDLKTFEISDAVKKIIALNTELSQLNEVLQQENTSHVENTGKYDACDAELSNFRLETTEFDSKLMEMQGKLSQLNTELVRSEGKIDGANRSAGEYRERQVKLKADIDNSISDKKYIIESITGLEKQIGELKENLEKILPAVEEKERIFNRAREEMFETQDLQSKINSGILDIVTKKTQMSNQLARVNSQIARCQTDAESRNREIAKLEEQQRRLENEKNEILGRVNEFEQNLASVKSDAGAFSVSYSGIKEKIDAVRARHDSAREQYIAIESKVKTLRDLGETAPKYRAIRAVLSREFPGVYGPVSSLIKIEPYHAELVSRTLGEKMNYLVCETVEQAMAAVGYLKENKFGQVTFVILEHVSNMPGKTSLVQLKEEKPVLSLMTYDSRWEKAMEFLLGGYYYSGSNVFSEGIVIGGSEPAENDRDIVLEISALESDMNKYREEYTKCEEELRGAENEFAGAEAQKHSLAGSASEIEIKLQSGRGQLKEKEEYIALNLKEHELASSEFLNITESEKELAGQAMFIGEEISNVEAEENALKAQLPECEKKLQEVRCRVDLLAGEYNASKTELNVWQERLKGQERELEKFNRDSESLENRVIKSYEEIELLEGKIREQGELLAAETKQMDEMYISKNSMEKELQEVQAQRAPISEKIEAKQKELDALEAALQEITKRLHEKEILYKTKEVEKSGLENKLKEFGVDFDAVKESHAGIDFREDDISRLKRRIESMGTVNLAAQEEYETLQQRYTWVQTQQQDLLKAEQDLRQAIDKINLTIKDSFFETFNKVKENFKKIFAELFEGGEADLILTDEVNLLEAGIEIIVQPPGKKLQNLSLLSGGEKALTAVALLFAFFLVRPSPVCILDEVDAPLDESNIVRFINLIKSFSEKVQFIMITHSRRTIEVADIIYGVTMEEFGVSKVLSLQLASATADKASETVSS